MLQLALIPRAVLADFFADFAIVGPITLLVMPLNAIQGSVMFWHRRHLFSSVKLKVRKNRRELLFYFFCYQFLMSSISLGGYVLELLRRRRRW